MRSAIKREKTSTSRKGMGRSSITVRVMLSGPDTGPWVAEM